MYLRASEIDAIPQIAWTTTNTGRIKRFNQRWYEYVGQRRTAKASSDQLERQWTAAIHRDDRRLCRQARSDSIANHQAFAVELRLRRADGVARWFHVVVSPLDPANKRGSSWIAICTDIDDYKRQGQQFAFIAKAGEVLAESLDLQTTLERLLAIIVPEFGDWAAIDLFDDYERLKTVAVIHADPRKMPLVTRLLGRYNHDPQVEPTIAAILRRNRPVILPVTDELIKKAAAPDLLETIRALAPRSTVTIPLRTRGRTIGSLVAYWAKTPRRYAEEDLPLFEELTKRAAVAIENARLYEREREQAEFQRAALPSSLPQVAGVRFSGIYVPANDRELLGGDWYDALRLNDGRIVVSIGDVAGTGLSAAVIMSSMRQVIRGVAQVYADPLAMLDAADRTLKTEYPETFVTAFVGVFDPVARTLSYASAGHPSPLVRDNGGAVTTLENSGLPLGLRVRGDTAASTVLPESSLVVFYSDGLVEAERDVIGGLIGSFGLLPVTTLPIVLTLPTLSTVRSCRMGMQTTSSSSHCVLKALRNEAVTRSRTRARAAGLSIQMTSSPRAALAIRSSRRYVTEVCARTAWTLRSWYSASYSGTSCAMRLARLKSCSTGAIQPRSCTSSIADPASRSYPSCPPTSSASADAVSTSYGP